MQISFKTITTFHTHHLQQDDVSLALHITSPAITNTHQHTCKAAAYLKPDITTTDAGEYRNRAVILTLALISLTALQKCHVL